MMQGKPRIQMLSLMTKVLSQIWATILHHLRYRHELPGSGPKAIRTRVFVGHDMYTRLLYVEAVAALKSGDNGIVACAIVHESEIRLS